MAASSRWVGKTNGHGINNSCLFSNTFGISNTQTHLKYATMSQKSGFQLNCNDCWDFPIKKISILHKNCNYVENVFGYWLPSCTAPTSSHIKCTFLSFLSVESKQNQLYRCFFLIRTPVPCKIIHFIAAIHFDSEIIFAKCFFIKFNGFPA